MSEQIPNPAAFPGIQGEHDEMRIAVAEALGWVKVKTYNWVDGVRTPMQWVDFDVLPNWPKDLNACHEMEKTLNESERAYFIGELMKMKLEPPVEHRRCHSYGYWKYVHATAPQRCEAFLRTKGLWEKKH